MSAHEIEAAIIRLTPQQLLGLISWLEQYHTEAGDLLPNEEGEADLLDSGMNELETAYEGARR
ncbi:MAG: hypothetical protein KF832_08425 [Caldilineaceae bacterium]|nr:hypothetical protein [Caldilineaceae bacterium]